MTVLADVYTAIHHVIKPLILIADGSKVNSHIQEREHEECIQWEQGRRCSSCSIWRWPSVMTSWCSSVWREKWTLSEPDPIDFSLPWAVWWAVRGPLLPAGQGAGSECTLFGRFCHVPLVAPQRVPGHGTARRHSHGPVCQWTVFLPGFTLQLAKAVQINLPLGLETCSVAYWTVKF